mmetsp:Transcript_13572/g.41250  ORF Transcript_13572/g.41250 Transcript_13572/m.41250 type:complete len:81 (-) Transcript_13572:82-324(-)|eukprot:scaffold20722_cov33-Tisochrysis_lutea.AAC.1
MPFKSHCTWTRQHAGTMFSSRSWYLCPPYLRAGFALATEKSGDEIIAHFLDTWLPCALVLWRVIIVRCHRLSMSIPMASK